MSAILQKQIGTVIGNPTLVTTAETLVAYTGRCEANMPTLRAIIRGWATINQGTGGTGIQLRIRRGNTVTSPVVGVGPVVSLAALAVLDTSLILTESLINVEYADYCLTAAARRIEAEDLSRRIETSDSDDDLGRLGAVLNDMLARRTGLTDAAKGLDPKAIQSSTQIGVEAVINGAQERVELVARVLCETGFRDLFTGLYNEICENPNPPRTLRINGKFVPYDTTTFDASMSVEVNPNLGKGNDMVRMMALSGIKNDQAALVAQMGLNNPICGPTEMLNTMTDMLALANVKNVGRYFKTPNPMQMQAMLSAPKQPDPQAMAAQAMMEKVRSETAKAVGQQHLDRTRMEQENTFKHNQLHAKTAIDLQKLDIEGQRMGVDHHVALAQLASQLMKDQSDQEGQDQKNQLDMADSQMKQDQTAQQGQDAERQAMLQGAATMASHRENMAKIASSHTQSMTQLAAAHHQAMTGHAMTGMGMLADRAGQEADQQHEAVQNDLDRQHQAMTTDATLRSQQTVAKMRPKPGPPR
jgi:hypothetical protein